MPVAKGGGAEGGGWEYGISEKDSYRSVIADYKDAGEGEYGPQGLYLIQCEERHPNGRLKTFAIFFNNTALGTEEKRTKLRMMAEAVSGKRMPQEYANEHGIDAADLVGQSLRLTLDNKISKNKEGQEAKFIVVTDYLPMRGADPLEVEEAEWPNWAVKKYGCPGGTIGKKKAKAAEPSAEEAWDGGSGEEADDSAPIW